jgi:RNA polymerase sigma factor (sigma-70 family)
MLSGQRGFQSFGGSSDPASQVEGIEVEGILLLKKKSMHKATNLSIPTSKYHLPFVGQIEATVVEEGQLRNQLMSEDQIIAGSLSGNRDCQRKLYEAYKVPMFRICLRYANDKMEAEDMLQDGFIRIFSDLQQFSGAGAFGGWIRRVMINACLMHIRKNKKFQDDVSLEVVADTQQTEEDIYSRLGAEMLTRLIRELPTGYRVVFNLFVVEGYTHQEIAEQLNINVNTSKSQLSKAKASLRRKLEFIIVS